MKDFTASDWNLIIQSLGIWVVAPLCALIYIFITSYFRKPGDPPPPNLQETLATLKGQVGQLQGRSDLHSNQIVSIAKALPTPEVAPIVAEPLS